VTGRSWKFAKNALDTKGYVLARVATPVMTVDVVSVHLDFKRDSERRSQLEDITLHLAERAAAPEHLVVAGDFNCGLDGKNGVLADFVARHALGRPPRSPETFPSRRPRRCLDHVLASATIEVRRTAAIAALVSDHLPVLAELAPRAVLAR
jgi:endonuclease/exonuclease/phosphatase family metal-dependent hydrolase